MLPCRRHPPTVRPLRLPRQGSLSIHVRGPIWCLSSLWWFLLLLYSLKYCNGETWMIAEVSNQRVKRCWLCLGSVFTDSALVCLVLDWVESNCSPHLFCPIPVGRLFWRDEDAAMTIFWEYGMCVWARTVVFDLGGRYWLVPVFYELTQVWA